MPKERSRERSIDAFIFKRTDFGEADQIVTLFSREEGKVRALVKAAKMPTSKLQPFLQPVFQSKVTVTGQKESSGLGKVIAVQPLRAYAGILDDEAKLRAWYVVSELLLRALPDGAPNEILFAELEQYAQFLDQQQLNSEQTKQSLAQFQIKAMAALGLGIRTAKNQQEVFFSLDQGGFVPAENKNGLDAVPVKPETFQSFQNLAQGSYQQASEQTTAENEPLFGLINRFVAHQLEREIKSVRLLI